MNHIKATILVVEDEQYIARVLETLLTADGYRVISAQNGAMARSHAFSHMPDVVLLDLGLPDIDGIQLLRHRCAGNRREYGFCYIRHDNRIHKEFFSQLFS